MSGTDRFEVRAGFLLDVLVQTVAVRVHGDNCRKILHGQMPHGFGRAELEERHAVDFLDGPRVELRGAADGVEIDGAVILEGRQRFGA